MTTDPERAKPIVADGFEPPSALRTANAVLRPLGPEHNESDHRAWTSSIDHITSTPGFGPSHSWPPAEGMSLESNLEDLVRHRADFDNRTGFTYTVLDPEDEAIVIGCLYIYADPGGETEVLVRSWVVANRAELDREVWLAVSEWLRTAWPFTSVRYAPFLIFPPRLLRSRCRYERGASMNRARFSGPSMPESSPLAPCSEDRPANHGPSANRGPPSSVVRPVVPCM